MFGSSRKGGRWRTGRALRARATTRRARLSRMAWPAGARPPVVRSELSCGDPTEATPLVLPSAWESCVSEVVSPSCRSAAATIRGPLKPGPKPTSRRPRRSPPLSATALCWASTSTTRTSAIGPSLHMPRRQRPPCRSPTDVSGGRAGRGQPGRRRPLRRPRPPGLSGPGLSAQHAAGAAPGIAQIVRRPLTLRGAILSHGFQRQREGGTWRQPRNPANLRHSAGRRD